MENPASLCIDSCPDSGIFASWTPDLIA